MRYLFLKPADLQQNPVRIEGAECHHLLNVLRVRVGEELVLLDGEGKALAAEVEALEKRAVVARVFGEAQLPPEPSVRITVAQALGKGDKFEQVVQHGVEAGAHAFIPLTTERAVVKLDAKAATEKRARWQLIAKGAAEQAHRGRVSQVLPVISLTELTKQFNSCGNVLLLHPEGETLRDSLIASPVSPQSGAVLLLVGPEGGFSPSEIATAKQAGARVVSLGSFVLRTETAALVAVSQVLYHYTA